MHGCSYRGRSAGAGGCGPAPAPAGRRDPARAGPGMRPANLLRWYPRAWRERYGQELLALIQDTLDEGRPTWRLRLGVIAGGLRERVHQAGGAAKAGSVKRLDTA